jgi:hypothetical protein
VITLLGTRDLHYCHIDSYRPNSVSAETKFKEFINHGNHGYSFMEVTIHVVFCYVLLCDLLEILNFNKYPCAVATRRSRLNSVEE